MKREDLQGIRGVAILLVLIFHLQPSVFSLGFVGVDMFFVLSGFLMSVILSREPFSSSQIIDFYSRRFKRIVPLMYIILVFVFFASSLLLIDLDKDELKKDLAWSLTFTSNIHQILEYKGYWDQISSYRFLIHCWSLGVEIQFYVIAPFLIYGTNLLSPLPRKIVLVLLFLCSLIFQLLSPPKISYHLLISRIWQFILGTLCFGSARLSRKNEDVIQDALEKGEKNEKSEEKWDERIRSSFSGHYKEVPLYIICLLVFFNWNSFFTEKIMRFLGSVTVAFLIRSPSNSRKSLLRSDFLVYMGDISYVLYLIHWPIIVFTKYYLDTLSLDMKTSILLCFATVILSTVLHHTLEKDLLSISLKFGCAICISCILLIVVVWPFYDDYVSKDNFSEKFTNALAYNKFESKKVYYSLPCSKDVTTEKWTNFTEEEPLRCETTGNGTLKVLVIGNSMAYRAFPLLHKVLNGRYKELRLFSRSDCPPISDACPKFTKAVRIVVDKIRPDILWNIHVDIRPPFVSPFRHDNDSVFLSFTRNIHYLSSRSKAVVIDLPWYWSNKRVAYEMVKRMTWRMPLDDFKVSKVMAEKQQEEHIKRIRAVKCRNCIYRDVQNQMFEGDTMFLYNRSSLHGYTNDGEHWTPEMLQRLTAFYQQSVDELIFRLEGK